MRTGLGWVVLQHVADEGPGAIADTLVAGGHAFAVARIDRGEPVPDPAHAGEMTGLVVMGGPMSVHDDEAHPWMAQEHPAAGRGGGGAGWRGGAGTGA
jgi:GMP synthase-like glutamine amidotransferase